MNYGVNFEMCEVNSHISIPVENELPNTAHNSNYNTRLLIKRRGSQLCRILFVNMLPVSLFNVKNITTGKHFKPCLTTVPYTCC